MKKIVYALPAAALLVAGLSACESEADTVAYNLSQEAEAFKINRRIVGINGITDKYLISIEGFCSVETGDSALEGALEITCKVGRGEFKKHFLRQSDNTIYVVEQLEASNVSSDHYKVIFRPQTIVPDIDLNTETTNEEPGE